jgi:plasmid maintenance system killer protein
VADCRTKRFPRGILKASPRGLDLLEAASVLEGLHAIRVNDQGRSVFRWSPQGPAGVRLVDYQ